MKKLCSFVCLLLPLMCYSVFADAQAVTGTVTSAKDGAALPGVTITIKGKNTGTQSDANGHYQLKAVSADAVLLFSFIGFQQKEIPLNSRSVLDVKLEEDQRKLDEIVVVGYGQQKKKDVTGSITSISAATIRDVPVTNAQQALQGRAPGIDVLNNSNKPGDEPRVRIRGNRSLTAGNDPLYVVDGIPFAGNLNDINPRDIASMDVLKDASATAIYGSRGANGVVLVTTLRGKEGKPVVTYDGSYGYVNTMGKTDIMQSDRYIAMKREAYRAAKLDVSDKNVFNAVERENIAKGVNTDWQDLMLSPGYQTSHALSVSGGTDKTKYALSGGYFRDQGVLKLQNYERYNLHVSIDQKIGKRFQAGVSMLGSYSMRQGETYNGMAAALKMIPIVSPYDDAGKLVTFPNGDSNLPNPLLDYVDGNRTERRSRIRVFASIYGEVEITEGLKYRLNIGPDIQQNNYGLFQGKNNTDLLVGGGDATARKEGQFVLAYTVENLLTYTKVINRKHAFNFTGLYSVQRQREDTSTAAVRGIPVESQEYYNLSNALNVTGIGSQLGSWTILSYMGRLNYTFDDRYLLTLTLRADGSSRFAPGKQWGYFPSVAAGWNITSEKFMQHQRVLDQLKLRVSFGKIGNTSIPPYLTQGALARYPYSFENKGVLGFQPFQPRNPDLTWETTTSLNAGLDFAFLKGRITGSVDVYRQHTTDLLLQRFLPYSNGFNSVLKNIGSTQNTGLEIGVSTINIDRPNGLQWSMDVNFYLNREKILTLADGKKDIPGNSWFIGYPSEVFYDLEKTGIWQTKAEADAYGQRVGDIQIRDANGDHKIDEKDRVVLGSSQPKWSGGTTQRLSYKNFDFSIVVFARIGGMIKSDFYQNYNTLFGRFNNLNIDYYTPENPTNDFPRPNRNQERPFNHVSLSYFDGSFVKIRNIALGYSLPASLLKRWQVQALRVHASVKQPLILAPYRQQYKGIDPEDVRTVGVDAPATWMLQFGINAKF